MSETTTIPPVELHEGEAAPDFELPVSNSDLDEENPDQAEQIVKLSDLRGNNVVLYFYPKDDTPGCTTEACNFRDNMEVLNETGALVYGISPDSVKAHDKFVKKFDLNFPLLADEGAQVATRYGVWKEKNMYGRKYMGVERTTFLINPEGYISKIWRKVKPAGHAEEVLKFLTSSL